jgi:hypothetical protein
MVEAWSETLARKIPTREQLGKIALGLHATVDPRYAPGEAAKSAQAFLRKNHPGLWSLDREEMAAVAERFDHPDAVQLAARHGGRTFGETLQELMVDTVRKARDDPERHPVLERYLRAKGIRRTASVARKPGIAAREEELLERASGLAKLSYLHAGTEHDQRVYMLSHALAVLANPDQTRRVTAIGPEQIVKNIFRFAEKLDQEMARDRKELGTRKAMARAIPDFGLEALTLAGRLLNDKLFGSRVGPL